MLQKFSKGHSKSDHIESFFLFLQKLVKENSGCGIDTLSYFSLRYKISHLARKNSRTPCPTRT